MTLDEKIKILDKFRGVMRAATVGLTFLWYFTLMLKFSEVHTLFINKYHYSIYIIFVYFLWLSTAAFPYPH
jgi:hypothetical protein